MSSQKDFIPALTGIRAIVVYFIFFKHLNLFDQAPIYTFLTFFLVLSGFVICYKYYSIRSLRRRELYNYYVNRISRVFPILFLLITFTFLYQYVKHLDTPHNIIKTYFYNITLLKGFSSTYCLTGIGPSWTLSVEEIFYILSPFIFLYTVRAFSLIKFVLLLYLIGIIITFIFIQFPLDGFFSSYQFTFYTTFFGRAFEFACGIYLALVVKGTFNGGFLKRIGKWSLYLGLSIILLGIIGQYYVALYYKEPYAILSFPGLVLNNIVMPIGIIFLFYSLVFHKSLLRQFLGSKLMVILGNCTYSFYLLHTSFVLSLITKYVGNNVWVIFICMVIVAFLFYNLVEQPISIFLRKKFLIRPRAFQDHPSGDSINKESPNLDLLTNPK
jgi:peptidoglycan/LPS O-acetylase OafA/YrhL